MNYEKHYNLLIARGKRTLIHGYRERHHIVPKCMGGTNDEANLVWLTAEEHFVAHQLLVKMYPDEYKLKIAMKRMCQSSRSHKRNNKMFGWIREEIANGISIMNTGRKHAPRTDEARAKMSSAATGRQSPNKGRVMGPMTELTRQKISASIQGTVPWNKGLSMTAETKDKLSKSMSRPWSQARRDAQTKRGTQ